MSDAVTNFIAENSETCEKLIIKHAVSSLYHDQSSCNEKIYGDHKSSSLSDQLYTGGAMIVNSHHITVHQTNQGSDARDGQNTIQF